jgi:D-alanyl-D-alanine carboxypeptidase
VKRLILASALLALALAIVQPAAGSRSSAPEVNARAYLVMNATTGDVLVSKNANARLAIASLTKLMTVDVALQHLSLDRYVTVSAQATQAGEEGAGLIAGEQILVSDLVQAALIQSANEAADALADAASGGNRALFVSWMNREARNLRLTRTHFARPDGLDAAGNYSSARDVTRLAQWVMALDEVRQAVRLRSSTISRGRVLKTWNDLLGVFPGVVGVKTGHTDDAGWCQATLLERDGLSIYVTVLGAPSRAQRNDDLIELLRFALTRYKLVEVVSARGTMAEVATEYGGPKVPVAASIPLALPVRLDRSLTEEVVVPRTLRRPVKKGQRVGEVRVRSNGKLLGKRDLIAMRSVERPSLFGKADWYSGQALHKLFGWA